ncbi:MAG: maleylpyruvate isomerase family mycothiol-dependent enzyme [Kineosporiaceae bacterium]|jgi:uncharacterized protein (TIGR03083 family)
MELDRAWQAIDAQRRAVTDLLSTLTVEEWTRPSLCTGWTVRDVAAHLTLQQQGLRDVLGMLAHTPPSGMNRMIREAARRKADVPTEQLVAEIAAMVGSRRHNLGVSHRETLIDILVHSQDIAVPLGRAFALDPEAAAVAASRVWSRGWPFYPRGRLRGISLVATDIPWSQGSGPEARGPIGAILLVLTGRAEAALPALTGEGRAVLQR